MTDTKRFFCSRCGKKSESLLIVYVDEEGRRYKYDRLCSMEAEKEREALLLSLSPAERIYKINKLQNIGGD